MVFDLPSKGCCFGLLNVYPGNIRSRPFRFSEGPFGQGTCYGSISPIVFLYPPDLNPTFLSCLLPIPYPHNPLLNLKKRQIVYAYVDSIDKMGDVVVYESIHFSPMVLLGATTIWYTMC